MGEGDGHRPLALGDAGRGHLACHGAIQAYATSWRAAQPHIA
jgi:hypothetical protein